MLSCISSFFFFFLVGSRHFSTFPTILVMKYITLAVYLFAKKCSVKVYVWGNRSGSRSRINKCFVIYFPSPWQNITTFFVLLYILLTISHKGCCSKWIFFIFDEELWNAKNLQLPVGNKKLTRKIESPRKLFYF